MSRATTPQDRASHRRYILSHDTGDKPLSKRDRLVAQAIADGHRDVRSISDVTDYGLSVVHLAIRNLRSHGVLALPAKGTRVMAYLNPGIVVHNNEIYILMRVNP